VPHRLLLALRLATAVGIYLGSCASLSSAQENQPQESPSHTSAFNVHWLDSVVSIERLTPPSRVPYPRATGFIVWLPSKHFLLCTAKHVVTGDEACNTPFGGLIYRLNIQGKPSDYMSEERLKRLGDWFFADGHDVGCRFFEIFRESKVALIMGDAMLRKASIEPGAAVVVLGFPKGLRSPEYPLPIMRSGIVARVDAGYLLIDARLFRGNSGGPVVYVPPFKIGPNPLMKPGLVNEERLIGVVSEGLGPVSEEGLFELGLRLSNRPM
jgi:hypothetical protein